VFGKVTKGMDIVEKIGNKGSDSGRPSAEVRFTQKNDKTIYSKNNCDCYVNV
jgi:cyclophilin family peptidyl-prolyl cis-trans isomerase